MRYDDDNLLRAMVDEFLRDEDLPASPEHDCPYLPDLSARFEGFQADRLSPEMYHALMDRGFRRSGHVLFRPVCSACQACLPLRVSTGDFAPSRSQRRVRRINRDLRVEIGRPDPTDEKHRLYVAYLDYQHDNTMDRDRAAMEDFLYSSPVHTLEICYRLQERLVAVSIVDRSRAALSSVYVYFGPEHARRSPGTYAALWEIDYCRRRGIARYYLGYYVAKCAKMNYKSRFGPCEILDGTHTWVPFSSQGDG